MFSLPFYVTAKARIMGLFPTKERGNTTLLRAIISLSFWHWFQNAWDVRKIISDAYFTFPFTFAGKANTHKNVLSPLLCDQTSETYGSVSDEQEMKSYSTTGKNICMFLRHTSPSLSRFLGRRARIRMFPLPFVVTIQAILMDLFATNGRWNRFLLQTMTSLCIFYWIKQPFSGKLKYMWGILHHPTFINGRLVNIFC